MDYGVDCWLVGVRRMKLVSGLQLTLCSWISAVDFIVDRHFLLIVEGVKS